MKIPKSRLNEFLKIISDNYTVYAPCATSAGAELKEWKEGDEVALGKKTNTSFKNVFFPQCEDIASFKTSGKSISVEEAARMSENFVVFGVNACDAKSFELLDKVFLSDPVDTFYKARREHGVVVTVSCTAMNASCFCTAFGVDPSEPNGDLNCVIGRESIIFEPKTDKGAKLLELSKSLLEEGGEEQAAEAKAAIKARADRLPLKDLDLSYWGGDELLEKFNSNKWGELSESCLGCGACTFVCPTCQCYDVRDFDTGSEIRRFRCWDSCMYKDFTMMAHGTPRPTKMQRFRQRFMHKLVYFPSNNEGEFGCVGCGRCLEKCPMGLNIVKVIKEIGGKESDR